MRSSGKSNLKQLGLLIWAESFIQTSNGFLTSDKMHAFSRSYDPFSSSLTLEYPQLLTQTRPLSGQGDALASQPISNLSTAARNKHGIVPRDISRFSHPMAAGAVAVQTQIVQPMMDKIGDLLRCTIEKSDMCIPMINPATVEAKFLSTMGHLALDAVALVGSPASMSASAFRTVSVLGHLCSTTACHVQGTGVTFPEELMFQVATLYFAFSNLFKHLSHHAVSRFLSPVLTSKDYRSFKLLFEPSGMTLYQYKTLSAFAVDWVTLEEGQVIHSDPESLYWLYKGKVHVQNHDSRSSYDLKANPITRNWSSKVQTGLLGDLDFLKQLDFPSGRPLSGGKSSSFQGFLEQFNLSACLKSNDDEECELQAGNELGDCKGESWTVGPGGATLLHIDTKNALSLLHEYDETLEKSLRSVVLQGIQSKLHISMSQS
ncbi:hypothetical protein ACA910_010892 [Epithemia clementina (nom. ined.)]